MFVGVAHWHNQKRAPEPRRSHNTQRFGGSRRAGPIDSLDLGVDVKPRISRSRDRQWDPIYCTSLLIHARLRNSYLRS